MPPASMSPSPFGLRFLIKILVLLFFLGVGVDHRDQKQQERHARKRQEQEQQEQQEQHQQKEGQNATAPAVQAAINATNATNATATPDSNDVLDDGLMSLPLDSPWLSMLGGLLLYKWIDWQLFDPLAPSLQDCVGYLRGAMVALYWPEAEMALAGTTMVTRSAYLAYQEKRRLDSLDGCWAHLQTTWWAEGLRAVNAARHTGPCESLPSPASEPATGSNDLPARNTDEIDPVLAFSADIKNQSQEQPSGNPLENEERTKMPTSMDVSPAWHRRYGSNFWRLLGRGGHYYGTALKFLAKASPAAQDWLGVKEGELKDWLGDLKEMLGIKLTEMEQKLERWLSRMLIGGGVSIPLVYYVKYMARRFLVGIEGVCVRVRTYARNWKVVQGKEGEAGWCENIKSGVSHMYRVDMGPWMLHLWPIIALLAEWWARGFRRRREQMRQAQPAAEEAGVAAQEKETKTERLPGGAGRMRMFSFARRSTEADRAIEEGVAAAAARAQEEDQEWQQLQEEEKVRGKRQHALLKILRTMAAQRRAADAVAMVDIYTKNWQLLRRLYALERDESKPWSVREKELKYFWPLFDAHWEALTTWTDGWIPRELSLLSRDASIEGAQLARLYARLARAVHTDTNYMWPRSSATRQDVKQKTQWRECADLAALRPHVLARYWRECGFARQQMWKQGVWAVMMSHPHIRASVTARKQNWKPRLRRRQLEHQQVPLWRSPGSGQPDVQLLHPIELRSLDVQEAAPGTGLENQVTLFGVDVCREGMLSPSKRPHLLQGWLDGPTEAKLVMAAMVPVRAAEQRRLLEVEPGIGTEQRKLRARLRALMLAFLTSHEMDTLETAAAGTTSLTTSMAGPWERLLLSHQAMPPAVVLEQARRRRAGEGVAEHKQRERGTETAPVLWPNVLELRLDLHRRPPSLDVIARHSHLAAVIMVRQQFPSLKAVEDTGRGTRETKSAPATAEGEGGGQAIGSVADEGMGGNKKGRGAGGGAKAFMSVPEPFVARRTTSIIEAPPVAARDVAAVRAPPPKPASVPMPMRTHASPPLPLPHLQCAAPCPPTRPDPLVAPQQRAVPPGRQVGWIRNLLYLVAMYGIPAYVFTVWAWYLYTQWVEEIVAQERATAARKTAAARAPTIDDVIRSLPAMGGIKVARMDWRTAE